MEKPTPLPYAATGQARTKSVLPIVALCISSSAVGLYVTVRLMGQPKTQLSDPRAVIYLVIAIGSTILGYIAVPVSAVAILRRRSKISVVAMTTAVIYWIIAVIVIYNR
jgi:hypothetical protein